MTLVAPIRLRVLPRIPPVDGQSIDLQATATHLQWRLAATDTLPAGDWEDLIALSEITGPVGPNVEFRVDGGFIQWRAEGDTDWNNLTSLSSITGPPGSPGVAVVDRTALAALDPTYGAAFLMESGREGNFVWASGDQSALVTADTAQGFFVPPASDATGASGAWYRADAPINPYLFGAAADGTTDDRDVLDAASALAVGLNRPMYLDSGTFLVESNVTLAARIINRGGIIKPDNGVTVTLSGSFDGPLVQCFDDSLGGVIAGSPVLKGGEVLTEWWGAVPDRSTDCTDAFISAVAFLKQYAKGASGTIAGISGVIQLLIGTYLVSDTVEIDDWNIRIRGVAPMVSSVLQTSATLDTFHADVSGGHGIEFSNFQIENSNSQPTAGAFIHLTAIAGANIHDMRFRNGFRSIDLEGCSGSPGKFIHNCDFNFAAATAASGATGILLRPGPGGTTDINSHVHIYHCVGQGLGADYCVRIRACDLLFMHNCDWIAATTACISWDNTVGSVTNQRFTAVNTEGGTAGADFSIEMIGSASNGFANLYFSNCQFVRSNGSNTAILRITNPNAKKIFFDTCEFSQSAYHGIAVERGQDITFNNCTILDVNDLAAGAASYFVLGDGSGNGPSNVNITNCKMSNPNEPVDPDFGIRALSGTTNLHIYDNRIRDITSSTLQNYIRCEIAATEIRAGRNDIGVDSITLAPAASLNVPIGIDTVVLSTGADASPATINNTAGANQSSFIGRELTIINDSGNTQTIKNGTGNFRAGGPSPGDVSLLDDGFVFAKYSATDTKWHVR